MGSVSDIGTAGKSGSHKKSEQIHFTDGVWLKDSGINYEFSVHAGDCYPNSVLQHPVDSKILH